MRPQEEVEIRCPYCGEVLWIEVDCSVEAQEYVEDCHVCCQPIELSVRVVPGMAPIISARHQDDA